MSRITIADLEVFYCVGVSEQERAKCQRLLISVDLDFDFSSAARSDRIEKTIDYYEIVRDLLAYGEGRSWKLLETLAANIADRIMTRYHSPAVAVEVKKFAIPQARYVSVALRRTRGKRRRQAP
ncbi:MAG: dihydroneopterin aldolase [Limisphaerales bacterium]